MPMRCVWCGAEDVKTRKDGKVFFCTECNMPLIFELEDDYVEIVKASEFRLEEWEEELRKRDRGDANDSRRR